MAIRHCFDKDVNQVLFEGNSSVKKIVLNRPQKLNSLSHHMVSQMLKFLKAYETDPKVKVVILKLYATNLMHELLRVQGNGKAFSVGGDVVASYTTMVVGHWSYGAKFYRKQLMLDYLVATYTKPVIALIDGIVMGGGAGLSMHASFKIVTENTVFAMPEAAIGYFVDVGASYFLSRLPGFFGEYLGLTGAQIKGAEMVACGLATHFVLSKDLHLLESSLAEVTSSDLDIISKSISKFVYKPNVKKDIGVYSRLEIINKCFSRNSVEEILSSLEIEAENRAEKWILKAINSMKSACPTSLKISLKSIREGRTQGLDQCIIREYAMGCHIIRRTVSNDFFEGVRALLLDKDKNPKWEPSKLELVSKEMVDRYFSKVDDDDDDGWEPLQLPARSPNTMRPKL